VSGAVSDPGHGPATAPATDTWTLADIPDQAGRTVLVTGTTLGGLGQFTALELARRGARVVLAGRRQERLDETRAAILDQVPAADLPTLVVDLADLGSVRRAAAEVAGLGAIDVLVNNAGVMAPAYSRTADGLELQMATNHYGPFLLTGLLLPQLVASAAGRVVTVSSQMHRAARHAPLQDPRAERGRYWRWHVYGQSKLANLLFTFELDRRLRAAELPVKALAAHPGFASTHLIVNGQLGRSSGRAASILDAAVKAVSPSRPDQGAWPTLMAATADLPGSTYCGPSGLSEWSGPPHVTTPNRLARDESAQRRLWELSEQVTGITYP
jgi:NAD(P)-dependent dehydrogenase (short-subunit alcohol dehydrogenase family)